MVRLRAAGAKGRTHALHPHYPQSSSPRITDLTGKTVSPASILAGGVSLMGRASPRPFTRLRRLRWLASGLCAAGPLLGLGCHTSMEQMDAFGPQVMPVSAPA